MRKHIKKMNLKVAIVTGGDCKLLNPAGTFFTSLRNNSPELYEKSVKYYFLYGEKLKDEIDALKSIGVIVKDMRQLAVDMPSVGHFSKGLIAKFIPFKLQESKLFDMSIWYDVDQINIKDMKDVIKTMHNEGASFIDGGATVANQFHLSKDLANDPNLSDIDFEKAGICGSFYTIRTCPDNSFEILKQLYKRYSKYLWLGEQGILDIFIQRYYRHRDTVHLDGKMFTPHPNEWEIDKLKRTTKEEQPYLLHSYGRDKFWDIKNPHILWKENNDKWMENRKVKYREKETTETTKCI